MKLRINTFYSLLLIITMMFVNSNIAQTVTVKMRINTSTVLDTLRPNHIVLVCGESQLGTDPAITWDKNTGIKAVNVGGDYWEATFKAKPGDVIKYKFVTYFNLDNPTFHWSGWEGPIDAGFSTGDNRGLIVGNKDTTLQIQYVNGWENKVPQYWKPFAVKQDSIAIYFRVNMGGANFDPSKQEVEVRGGAPLGTDNPWIKICTLQREVNSVNGGSFWSGVAYIAKSAITPGMTQQFKFVIKTPETWESTPNRSFTFTEDIINSGEYTVHWYYFNDVMPRGSKVTANVLFRLRLDALEKANLFNRALGDKVGVTGPKGWAAGNFNFDTDPTVLKMTYNSDLEEWNLLEPFTLFPNEVLSYKYYIAWDSSRVDPNSPNYIPGLQLTNGWEEPGVTGGADRKYTYTDQTEQIVPGDFGAEYQFFNSIHPNGVIKNPLKLKFKIDMTPATNVATNATNPLFRPGIDTAYIQFDGSLIPITQGKTMYGADNRVMLSDPDGDMIYTGEIDLNPPTFYQVCYRIVYTSPQGEIWNGGGVQKGRRYYQYILPVSINPVVWPDTYELALMQWKSSDLTVEDHPNLGPVTEVESMNTLPNEYKLYQNYPNPFNPSTVITYAIPKAENVKLEIYNVLGQKVVTLFEGQQFAGTHSISWNAKNYFGQDVASGIYFVKLTAGSFTQAKKMMLIR
ncbi:MAG: T9SS type A sorting domain-containing protein [Melioribacteraceae bacterium]